MITKRPQIGKNKTKVHYGPKNITRKREPLNLLLNCLILDGILRLGVPDSPLSTIPPSSWVSLARAKPLGSEGATVSLSTRWPSETTLRKSNFLLSSLGYKKETCSFYFSK
ncbi:unnamed protein product [Vicia faba]|uniref:Uncharacterized protein n=1 Tax=Vicia faba TaxID=3906 RepID=A0AAV0ZSN9_VICFA|nr:unnamed protein product [Vicia faba]